MKTLRPYQDEFSSKARMILLKQKIIYMAWEPRTGKTATGLSVCDKLMGAQPPSRFNVLFLTTLKTVGSIKADYEDFGFKFNLTVINYESAHKIDLADIDRFDVVILDEAHKLGAYPKISKFNKISRTFIDDHTFVILMSGTPAAESQSMLYHQFDVSPHSPWDNSNFYSWAKTFTHDHMVNHGRGMIKDYSKARPELIEPMLEGYLFSFTQQEAGVFDKQINENILEVKMSATTEGLVARIIRDRIIIGNDPSKRIIADTAAKLQQKVHQLCSGTIKFEEDDDGNQVSATIDNSKAIAIKNKFKGESIAILYNFVEEGKMLEREFPNFTRDWQEFERNPQNPFIGQIISSREGISLWKADHLIYFNIAHSAVSYLQGRDRLTKQERVKDNNVWFVVGSHRNAIEPRILNTVKNKEDYNSRLFCLDYNITKNRAEQILASRKNKLDAKKPKKRRMEAKNQMSMFN